MGRAARAMRKVFTEVFLSAAVRVRRIFSVAAVEEKPFL
jgi:hypothetical protein